MLGLYGLMAFSLTRRTREIGIRLALGAKPASMLGMAIREMLPIAGGANLGHPPIRSSSRHSGSFFRPALYLRCYAVRKLAKNPRSGSTALF
jgi:hypothetical protein